MEGNEDELGEVNSTFKNMPILKFRYLQKIISKNTYQNAKYWTFWNHFLL